MHLLCFDGDKRKYRPRNQCESGDAYKCLTGYDQGPELNMQYEVKTAVLLQGKEYVVSEHFDRSASIDAGLIAFSR